MVPPCDSIIPQHVKSYTILSVHSFSGDIEVAFLAGRTIGVHEGFNTLTIEIFEWCADRVPRRFVKVLDSIDACIFNRC